jgi:hypothetical protein
MTPESKRDLVDISSLSEVPMMNAAATASNPANVFSATNVGGIPAANHRKAAEILGRSPATLKRGAMRKSDQKG